MQAEREYRKCRRQRGQIKPDEEPNDDNAEQPNDDNAEQPDNDDKEDFDYVRFASDVVNIVADNRRLRDRVVTLEKINENNEKIIALYKEVVTLFEARINSLLENNTK